MNGLANVDVIDFICQLAIILISAKLLGLLMRKLGLPQVLGFILAGLLIGPAIWELIFNVDSSAIFPISDSSLLRAFAEVGVIFVMFTAGLETNLKDIKETGLASFTIALCGVLVPLGLGIGIGALFLPTAKVVTWVFIGVIMTATSVGITVEVLRELGKLKSKVGTIILSAAVIDDVLGIIILAITLSVSGNGISSPVLDFINPGKNIYITIAWILTFFVFAICGGFGLSKLFKYMEKRSPHTRRIPILSIAVCLLYSFVAEKVFGVADITGAYICGLALSTNHASAEYVDRKVSINSYTLFAPIFFAGIGIKISFSGLGLDALWFALVFAATAIIAKIIGCGGASRFFKFKWKDALKIGVGMIARGEVALIVTEKGIEGGLLDPKYRVITVMLVVISSLLAPILLKALFKNDDEKPLPTKQALEEGSFE